MRRTLQLLKARAWSEGALLIPFGLQLAFTLGNSDGETSRNAGAATDFSTEQSRPTCTNSEWCAARGCSCGGHLPPPAA